MWPGVLGGRVVAAVALPPPLHAREAVARSAAHPHTRPRAVLPPPPPAHKQGFRNILNMNMINDKRISRPDEAPEHPVPGLVPVAAQPLPAAGQQGGVLLVPVAHAGVHRFVVTVLTTIMEL